MLWRCHDGSFLRSSSGGRYGRSRRELRRPQSLGAMKSIPRWTKWRKQLRQDPERAFRGNRKGSDEEARIGELERMVGRLTMENELLKKALARLEEQRLPSVAPTSDDRGDRAGTNNCAVVGGDLPRKVNRAAYYRTSRRRATTSSCAMPSSESPWRCLATAGRITAELRRRGLDDQDRKRVSSASIREDNLLCLRRVQRVRTTDSRHAGSIRTWFPSSS